MEKIVFTTLQETAEKIKNKEISCVDLIQTYYEHISKYNPIVNAISDLLPIEKALHEARLLDEMLANGVVKGSLHGIPITVKDSVSVKGLKNSFGVPTYKNHIATQDATLITYFKNAGAIIIGKSNLPLLMLDWCSENSWYGRTNNPYDLSKVPGGSSGGSAAALASGFSMLEIGSDVAGSIRVPAHFCGICGLRPTEALLETDGIPHLEGAPKAMRFLSVMGPMARTIGDLEIALDVLWNKESLNIRDFPIDLDQYLESGKRPLKIAYSPILGGVEIDHEYAVCFNNFIEKLRNEGHELIERKPEYDRSKDAESWANLLGFDLGANMPKIPFISKIFSSFIYYKLKNRDWQRGMRKVISGDIKSYALALTHKDSVAKVYAQFLNECDVWLTPVCADSAFKHQKSGKPFMINSKEVAYSDAFSAYTCDTALPGHPICVFPIGTIKGNMPVGIQVHAKRWHDKRLLQIAKELEKLTEGYKIPQMFE